LAKLAKTNSLTSDQYIGGSITVSNLGMFGISEFAAIISPPQASILAVGKIIKKPIVIKDEIKIGNTLKSTLSADHRVLDGAVAGKLLKDFNDIIEHPFEIWMKSSDMRVI
jgi:pyruvate dehydrogenase E2 component (dihydrolipoamide acetyltransferase)